MTMLDVLSDFGVFTASRARRVELADSLVAAEVDRELLRGWLADLALEYAENPIRARRVAAKVLANADNAKAVLEDHARAAANHRRLVGADTAAVVAHDVNRDLDAEERRRQRHAAESVFGLGESVDVVSRRYGYPREDVERFVREWAPQFGQDPAEFLGGAT